jgi:hypothetical protein
MWGLARSGSCLNLSSERRKLSCTDLACCGIPLCEGLMALGRLNMATATSSERHTAVHGLGEIALRVNDLDTMQKFYEEVSGLPLILHVARGYPVSLRFPSRLSTIRRLTTDGLLEDQNWRLFPARSHAITYTYSFRIARISKSPKSCNGSKE